MSFKSPPSQVCQNDGEGHDEESTQEGSLTTQRISSADLQVKQCKSGGVIIVETPTCKQNKQLPIKNTHPSDTRVGSSAPH